MKTTSWSVGYRRRLNQWKQTNVKDGQVKQEQVICFSVSNLLVCVYVCVKPSPKRSVCKALGFLQILKTQYELTHRFAFFDIICIYIYPI